MASLPSYSSVLVVVSAYAAISQGTVLWLAGSRTHTFKDWAGMRFTWLLVFVGAFHVQAEVG